MRKILLSAMLCLGGLVACSSTVEPSGERTSATRQASTITDPGSSSLEDTDPVEDPQPGPSGEGTPIGQTGTGNNPGGGVVSHGDPPPPPPPPPSDPGDGLPPQDVTVHGGPRVPPKGSGSANPGEDGNPDQSTNKPTCGVPGMPPCPKPDGCYDDNGNELPDDQCKKNKDDECGGDLMARKPAKCYDPSKVCIRISEGNCYPDLKWNYTSDCLYVCYKEDGSTDQQEMKKSPCEVKYAAGVNPDGRQTTYWASTCPPAYANPYAW